MADPPDQRIKLIRRIKRIRRTDRIRRISGSGGSADQVDQRIRQPRDHKAGPQRYCRIRGLVGSGAATPRLQMNLIVEWFPIKINTVPHNYKAGWGSQPALCQIVDISFQGSGRHVFWNSWHIKHKNELKPTSDFFVSGDKGDEILAICCKGMIINHHKDPKNANQYSMEAFVCLVLGFVYGFDPMGFTTIKLTSILGEIFPHHHRVQEELAIKASFVSKQSLGWEFCNILTPWNFDLERKEIARFSEGSMFSRVLLEFHLLSKAVSAGSLGSEGWGGWGRSHIQHWVNWKSKDPESCGWFPHQSL